MDSTLLAESYFRSIKRTEMYYDLYEYLILKKQLSVPGIGTFLLETKPAETDFTHRQINPPVYTISLHHGSEKPAKKLFYWLADKLNIHYNEAIVRFNGFAYDLKNQVLSGNKISWENVGVLSKGMEGEVRFESGLKEYRFDPPVSAARIIREKAVHYVRVGEQEKTSAEMAEWLNPEDAEKSYWWAPALIAAIVLVIFTGIYFSQQGVSLSSAANQQKLSSQKGSATYTIFQ
jgi:hypothetical protein